MTFFAFMSSMTGRVLRGVVGFIIFLLGVILVSANPWWLVAIVIGFVVMTAGLLDLCLFAPLARLPLKGALLRERLARK